MYKHKYKFAVLSINNSFSIFRLQICTYIGQQNLTTARVYKTMKFVTLITTFVSGSSFMSRAFREAHSRQLSACEVHSGQNMLAG